MISRRADSPKDSPTKDIKNETVPPKESSSNEKPSVPTPPPLDQPFGVMIIAL